MVIKTLSRKATKISFKNIINYVDRQDKRTAKSQLFDPYFRVLYNLRGSEKEEVIEEFEENFELYNSKRKNAVGVYHEIMSFRKEDDVTQEIIEDLAYTYLDRRTPKGLAYGAVHTDKDHVHLHLVISSNQLMSKKANRLSQKEFLEVRQYIEQVQKERYPQIKSIVYDDLKLKKELRQEQDKNTRREKRYKVESRGVSQKEMVLSSFLDAMDTAEDAKEFHQLIQEGEGRDLYIYRDKVAGIIEDGRKYRFSNLLKSIEDPSEKEKCLKKLETFRRLGLLQQVIERSKEMEKSKGRELDLDLTL